MQQRRRCRFHESRDFKDFKIASADLSPSPRFVEPDTFHDSCSVITNLRYDYYSTCNSHDKQKIVDYVLAGYTYCLRNAHLSSHSLRTIVFPVFRNIVMIVSLSPRRGTFPQNERNETKWIATRFLYDNDDVQHPGPQAANRSIKCFKRNTIVPSNGTLGNQLIVASTYYTILSQHYPLKLTIVDFAIHVHDWTFRLNLLTSRYYVAASVCHA